MFEFNSAYGKLQNNNNNNNNASIHINEDHRALLLIQMSTWFYHRRNRIGFLVNNTHQPSQVKTKTNLELSRERAHAKMRDSLGQFTINVMKRHCISTLFFDFNAFYIWFPFFCFERNACSIEAINAPYYDYLCDSK